jgi:SAM-dependent methyltransferase
MSRLTAWINKRRWSRSASQGSSIAVAPRNFDDARKAKIERLEPFLRTEMPHRRAGLKYDFLSDELSKAAGIVHTDAVSSHGYDGFGMSLVNEYRDGLLLDCGAGRRPIYFDNVVNYEIVDYDSTDIIGVGEELPFKDATFDAVLSIAVLEHVRDPFTCSKEIVRVLKPGGKLLCCVPFLQPLHGYPNHYYNMSSQGLRALFDRSMVIDDHKVIESILPIWTLTWIVERWAAGLSGATKTEFLDIPLREFLKPSTEFLNRSWVKELPMDTNFELASATLLFAHKPPV